MKKSKMIEKQFLAQKIKENQIQKYLAERLAKSGYSHTEIKRTPLGEKVIIYTTRPGLVVGGKGENIQNLTNTLKKQFKMENPQIEIGEVENPLLDVFFVCDRIVSTLERFGSNRFKSVGYRTLQGIIDSGALGAEIIISGKVPSARARSWRFSAGYMKKSGDVSENYVKRTCCTARLKSGIIGVKVSIMLPDTPMPDRIEFKIKAKTEVQQNWVEVEKLDKDDGQIKKIQQDETRLEPSEEHADNESKERVIKEQIKDIKKEKKVRRRKKDTL